jgi:hypothetical protein
MSLARSLTVCRRQMSTVLQNSASRSRSTSSASKILQSSVLTNCSRPYHKPNNNVFYYSASSRSFSTTSSKDFDKQQGMDTPMSDQSAEPTLLERSNKNLLQKFLDKYSFSRQTNRILMAESFLQAATAQASDP